MDLTVSMLRLTREMLKIALRQIIFNRDLYFCYKIRRFSCAVSIIAFFKTTMSIECRTYHRIAYVDVGMTILYLF